MKRTKAEQKVAQKFRHQDAAFAGAAEEIAKVFEAGYERVVVPAESLQKARAFRRDFYAFRAALKVHMAPGQFTRIFEVQVRLEEGWEATPMMHGVPRAGWNVVLEHRDATPFAKACGEARVAGPAVKEGE